MPALITTVSGAASPLEACRQVGRVSQRQLFLPATSAHRTHDDQACINPHADGELDAVALLEAGIQPRVRLQDPEASTHRPLGIVLMRLGIAKVDEQSIAQILRNVPLKTLDDRGAGLLIGPHHLAPLFGVDLAGEGGRVHQLTE